jgi:hypothetical protein
MMAFMGFSFRVVVTVAPIPGRRIGAGCDPVAAFPQYGSAAATMPAGRGRATLPMR